MVGLGKTANHSKERCFATSLGPTKVTNFPFSTENDYIIDCNEIAESLCDSLQFEDHGTIPVAMGCILSEYCTLAVFRQKSQGPETGQNHKNEHDGDGTGHSEKSFFCHTQNIERRQIIPRRNQKDNRTHGNHSNHEGIDEPCNEGRTDERENDLEKGLKGAGPHVDSSLLDGDINLVKLADAGLEADRQVSKGLINHHDGKGAGELQRWRIEGNDITNAHDRSGYSKTQKGHKFDDFFQGIRFRTRI